MIINYDGRARVLELERSLARTMHPVVRYPDDCTTISVELEYTYRVPRTKNAHVAFGFRTNATTPAKGIYVTVYAEIRHLSINIFPPLTPGIQARSSVTAS